MRTITFNVPIYDWEINIVTIYNYNDAKQLKEFLKSNEVPDEVAKPVVQDIHRGCVKGGVTVTVQGIKNRIVIVIYPFEEKEYFWDTINHEKRHAVDKILEIASIKDIEAAAYLDGYISKYIFSNLKELL